MKRVVAGFLAVAIVGYAVAGFVRAQTSSYPGSDLRCANAVPGDGWNALAARVGAPSGIALANQEGGTLSSVIRVGQRVCYGPPVVAPPVSTIPPTIAPATSTTTSTTSTTVAPTTSTTAPPATTVAPPAGAQFVETFATAASLDRLDAWVYHRNVDLHEFDSFSGGDWTGDHDHACGAPATQRPLSFDTGDSQAERVANGVYWCPNGTGHFMTSMGDVDGYSITSFSPRQVFASIASVCADASLNDLGTRQWLKIGVVTDSLYQSRPVDPDVPGFLVSDVAASDLPTSLATPNRLLASYSGGASAGYPGGLKIGDTNTDVVSNPSPTDRAIRHPLCLTDNRNGTVTFTVAGVSVTRPGAFPAGPVRAVVYQNSYTPSKSESGSWSSTIHWDNLIVT